MTYHKRPVQTRKCAHCRTKFESNHKSRLYCCQSCNTLAWRARQLAAEPATPAGAGEGAVSLALSAQNVGLLALGSALGTAAVQGGTALWQQATQGGTPLDWVLAEVQALRRQVAALDAPPRIGFLPEAVRALAGPVVPLVWENAAVACVRADYHGHVLYHNAAHGLLLWEERPGAYRRLASDPELARLVDPARQPAPPRLAPAADAAAMAALDAAVDAILFAAPTPTEEAAAQAAQAAFNAALWG